MKRLLFTKLKPVKVYTSLEQERKTWLIKELEEQALRKRDVARMILLVTLKSPAT